jgi:hypothetical protein
MLTRPALAIRYPGAKNATDADGGFYICSDRKYGLASLSRNARSHTRRGLARCEVEKMGFDYFARNARTLNQQDDTLSAVRAEVPQGLPQ